MMMDELIELSIVHPIYKTKTVYQKMQSGEIYPEEKQVLVKQIAVKKWINKNAIGSIEEKVTAKNTIAKERSIIFDRFSQRYYETFHNPQHLIQTLNTTPMKNQIGFTYDTKIHTSRPQILKPKKRRRKH